MEVSFARRPGRSQAPPDSLNPAVWRLDFNDQYNVWSGLIGGMFLMLAYFGCDQIAGSALSHRQRLRRAGSACCSTQSRRSRCSFSSCLSDRWFLSSTSMRNRQSSLSRTTWPSWKSEPTFRRYRSALTRRGRRDAPRPTKAHICNRVPAGTTGDGRGARRSQEDGGKRDDTNYVFLSFVTHYMPAGIVGLVMAAIFARRHVHDLGRDQFVGHRHGDRSLQAVLATREDGQALPARCEVATAFWGVYAIVTAQLRQRSARWSRPSTSLARCSMAVHARRVRSGLLLSRATGAAVLRCSVGEAVVFTARYYTDIAFLWYNVIGAGTLSPADW